jgi:quercetin dioxygenase-like cupin family protein
MVGVHPVIGNDKNPRFPANTARGLVLLRHRRASFRIPVAGRASSLHWRFIHNEDLLMFRFIPLALAACATLAHAAPPEPVVTTLMNQALSDAPGKEVMMLTVDYAPGAADPVHRHDAHGFVYVLEGTIVMGVDGGKEKTLHAGETFYEGPRDVHTVGRNASKTKPARFVVFLLKEKDKPALIPVTHR